MRVGLLFGPAIEQLGRIGGASQIGRRSRGNLLWILEAARGKGGDQLRFPRRRAGSGPNGSEMPRAEEHDERRRHRHDESGPELVALRRARLRMDWRLWHSAEFHNPAKVAEVDGNRTHLGLV